jgi:Bacterial SH3 domain
MACPSCGAPPRDAMVPPPLPTQTSRAKQLSRGTIALLTGMVLVLVIRGVTYQRNTPSVAVSPTPAASEATTMSPPPDETALQSPSGFTTAETSTAEANTKDSQPVEAVSQSSPSLAAAETPTAEVNTKSSPLVEAASQSSPSLAAETTTETTTTSSPAVEETSQDSASRIAAEPQYASDVSTTTAPRPQATYHVVGIPLSDYLNVRGGAGSDYEVVTKLEPGERGILLGAKRVAKGATTWQEITVHGQTGWVNAAYIAPETEVPTSPTESSTVP